MATTRIIPMHINKGKNHSAVPEGAGGVCEEPGQDG